MLEIEMKFPVANFERIRALLAELNARPDTPLDEADHYYNAPDRDFAQTDEAFRLRRVGDANRITYKGPKHAGLAKTRTEIELGLEPGAEAAEKLCRLVEHLGYRPVALVRKRRTIYRLERDRYALEVCLDDVVEVGQFVEVEIIAPEEQKESAERTLQTVARELGLTQSERRSYLELYLSRRA